MVGRLGHNPREIIRNQLGDTSTENKAAALPIIRFKRGQTTTTTRTSGNHLEPEYPKTGVLAGLCHSTSANWLKPLGKNAAITSAETKKTP
jgi:hypothetical protein